MNARRLVEVIYPGGAVHAPRPRREFEETPFDEELFKRFVRSDPLLSRMATRQPLEVIYNSEVLGDHANMDRWNEFVSDTKYRASRPAESLVDALLSEGPLPPDHEAHEIPSDDLEAASSKLDDMGNMISAYERLFGPNPDMQHVNAIEGIWATSQPPEDARQIAQYLQRVGIEPEGGAEAAAREFAELRQGEEDNQGYDDDGDGGEPDYDAPKPQGAMERWLSGDEHNQ